MTAAVLAARPGLSELVERVRSALPEAARAALDQHVTQAERVAEDVLRGVPVWRLAGDDGLWVRLPDLAEVMEVTGHAARKMTSLAVTSCELTDADVRRGVREAAGPATLTRSRTGVTMLSLRACLVLTMKCQGARGVAFRAGLLRMLDTAAELERACAVLLLDRAAPPVVELDGFALLQAFNNELLERPRRARGDVVARFLRDTDACDRIAVALLDDPRAPSELAAAFVAMPARSVKPLRDYLEWRRRYHQGVRRRLLVGPS